MDRSVLISIFAVCLLAQSSTLMGAGSRPSDFPPSLEAFIKFNQDEKHRTHEHPLFLAWKDRIAEIFSLQMIEKSCLATAIYFEARSEPALGQLAVANVIINRAKTPTYPSTICGVVFQGSNHFNACQFSFACDGKSDVPQAGRAWRNATAIANLLLPLGKKKKYEEFMFVSTATHYHAVEVEPRWAKSLSKLNQIGRHIFYS
jgi:hypothetical protein